MSRVGGAEELAGSERSSPARRIARARTVPGARAVVGGLLIAVAAVGTFVAAGGADAEAGDPVVVAARDLRPGLVLGRDDLRVERATLPAGARAFTSVDELVGRAALGPVGAGEVVQASAVTPDRDPGTPRREVALTLPRPHLAVGALRVGDRVDVYVTDDETAVVAAGVEVVALSADDGGGLTREREVRLVVAVESPEAVTALVHGLRTGDVTVVRSTFAAEQPAGDATADDEAGDR